jgi:hypothetical protein
MRPSRFTDEQIIAMLKEQEADAKAGDLDRRGTLHFWKAKYGGMDLSDAKRLKAPLDFVHDQFACGRRFRVLNIVTM